SDEAKGWGVQRAPSPFASEGDGAKRVFLFATVMGSCTEYGALTVAQAIWRDRHSRANSDGAADDSAQKQYLPSEKGCGERTELLEDPFTATYSLSHVPILGRYAVQPHNIRHGMQCSSVMVIRSIQRKMSGDPSRTEDHLQQLAEVGHLRELVMSEGVGTLR
ncbi:hypothetical protein CMV_020269, partial [Castanea mollissima]